MSLKPTAAAASPRLLDGRLAGQKIRFARPLLFRQLKERLSEKVFLAANVLRDGVGAVVTATETRPFLGAQTAAAIATIWICPCQQKKKQFNGYTATLYW